MTIHATLYECAHTPAPASRDTFDTWEEFTEALTDLTRVEAPTKAQCPYFGPYALEGETRNDANVSALSCVVVDVDALASVDALLSSLDAEGVEAFVYESPSSTDDAPRVRIVCPTTRPITRAEAAHTRLALAEALGLAPGSGVDGALPASLGFYAGRVRGTRERKTWQVAGKPVDVDALMATPLKHTWGKRAATTPREPRQNRDTNHDTTAAPTERVLELAARVEARWLEGGRETDNFEKAFYGWLLGAGWSRGEVVALVECLDSSEPDAAKRREHAKKARAAVALPGPSDAVRAWFGPTWGDVDTHVNAARRDWWAAREARRDAKAAAERGDDHALGRRVALGSPITPVRYLAEALGIGWAGKVAAIHGYAGTSKGFLLSLVALHVAAGLPLFGKPVARVPVLYLDAETEPLASNRMKQLARGLGIDLAELEHEGWIVFVDMRGGLVGALPTIGGCLSEMDRGDGALVCLDSYSSTVEGDEVKSEYAEPLWELGQVVRQANAVALVVMHERKAGAMPNAKASALEGISGTNRLAAALVTSIRMTRDDESNECCLLVTSTRAPGKRFAPFYLTWTDRDDGAIVATLEGATVGASGKASTKEDYERRVEHYVTTIERELRDSYDRDPGASMTASVLRGVCGASGADRAYAEAVSRCQYKRRSITREPGRGSSLLYRATPNIAVNVGGKFERRVVTPSKVTPRERAALDATVARLAKK